MWKGKSFPACLRRDELWICFSLTPVCPRSKNCPPHTAPPHTKRHLTSPQSLSQPRMLLLKVPPPLFLWCLFTEKMSGYFLFRGTPHSCGPDGELFGVVTLLYRFFLTLQLILLLTPVRKLLLLVAKPTAAVHFLLFGPWQMVPRYYGTNSSEVDWNFYSSFPSWILGASVSHTFPSYNFHCILYSSAWHAPYPWNPNSNRILSNAANRREMSNLCEFVTWMFYRMGCVHVYVRHWYTLCSSLVI